MKAELIEYLKQDIRGKYVMEIRVWKVDDKRYPDGMKYSLIFVDKKSGKKVLMDNHHPKKPHVHLDDVELPYDYVDTSTLIDDFKQFVSQHFGEKI